MDASAGLEWAGVVAIRTLRDSEVDTRVSRYSSFAELPGAVADSLRYSRQRSFFASSDWFQCLHRSGFSGDKRLLLCVFDQPKAEHGESGGLYALFLVSDADTGRLDALANYYTVHFLCPGIGTIDPSVAMAEILLSLKQSSERGLELVLRNLPEHDSGTQALITQMRCSGLSVDVQLQYANWYCRTEGHGFAAYMSRRPHKLRNTLRRKKRNLERDHETHFRMYDSPANLDEGIHDYLKVYGRSWKRPEEPVGFIPQLIRLCAELALLRLGILYVDGTPAAAQFWIKDRSTAYIYKLAHDPDFSAFSAGSLLTARMFEHAIDADRVEEIDFGTGDEAYKRDWVDRRRMLLTVHAVDPYCARGAYLRLRWRTRKALQRIGIRKP